MELFDRHEATELRDLFAAMDGANETDARAAMTEAAGLLHDHDYSFRHIVQEVDGRGLLLPTKVGAAIKLMDSTMMAEAASAFSGARRLMRTCGLTFAGILEALDREPISTEDLQRLTLAYKLEVERSRELQTELHKLRANAAAVAAAVASGAAPPVAAIHPHAAPSPLRNVVVVTTLLLGLGLAASIVTSFADMYRSANATTQLPPPVRASAAAPGAPSPATAVRGNPPLYNAPTSSAPAVAMRNPDPVPFSLSPPRAGWNCWRNRGTQGTCF